MKDNKKKLLKANTKKKIAFITYQLNSKYDYSKKIITYAIKRKCDIFGKYYYDKSTLNTHLSNAHGSNKKKRCDICGASFIYLNKHIKKVLFKKNCGK